MHVTRIVAGVTVAVLAAATTLAAQTPPRGARRPAANPPAAGQQQPGKPGEQEQRERAPAPRAEQAMGGGTAQYLTENPHVLQLTPTQVARIRKVSSRVDSLNAPLRAEMQQLTRGQQIRDMPPAERRRAAPQLQNVMRQMRANNDASIDSIDAILSPDQAARLEAMREDFKAHREARRAAVRERVDTARARAGQRPPRP